MYSPSRARARARASPGPSPGPRPEARPRRLPGLPKVRGLLGQGEVQGEDRAGQAPTAPRVVRIPRARNVLVE